MYQHFLARHITRYNGQWYCYLCKLKNLTDVERHLQEVHSDINFRISDFTDNFSKLSDTKCKKLLYHGIVMKDILQNSNSENTRYFCILCKCSIPTLDHVNQHMTGKQHQKYASSIKLEDFPNEQQNSNINDNGFINIKVKTELISNTKFFARIHPVCKDKLTKNNSTNNSEIKEEEESLASSESDKKNCNSNNILQIERCVNMSFCILCDRFDHKNSIKKHIQEKQHKSALKILKKNREVICIINFEKNRKTIKPLQLNSRKLNGTMWPEYTNTISKYTCDQCNIVIKENDIINHEVTIHKESMTFSIKDINDLTLSVDGKNIKINISSYYPMFKCSFCNEIIHGISMLENHFSKCQHKENIKLLIKIKRQEYNHSKNVESFFELLEFLNLISFKNNGDIVQTMEQPVMYIKNHRASIKKNSDDLIENKFTYICIACKFKFYTIKDVFDHLSTKDKHLKHFQNILLTYNYIHNICIATKELGTNKTQADSLICTEQISIDTLEEQNKMQAEQYINNNSNLITKINSTGSENKTQADSLICTEKISIDTLEKQNINKTQAEQYINNNSNLIAKISTGSKNDISQSENSNSGLFMSRDISLEMRKFIRNIPAERIMYKSLQTTKKNNVLDRYNRMYCKKFLDFEEIMFAYNQNKLNEIKLSLQLYVRVKCGNMYCLACNVTHSYDIHTLYEHIRCEQHIMQLTQLYQSNEEQRLRLLKELIKVEYTNMRCYACDKNEEWMHCGEPWIIEHMYYPIHKKNRKKSLKEVENVLQEYNTLWYNIQYFACVQCNIRFKIKIEFMEHLDKKHKMLLNTKDNSKFDFCLTCATLWYKDQDSIYRQHCRKRTHQYLVKSNDFAVTLLPQSLQQLLKNVNENVIYLFKLSNDALYDSTMKTTILVKNLKDTFKSQEFHVEEICMFGSRVTGLALPNSDIDIYLKFSDECTEAELIKNRSKKIQNCLYTDNENWEIELILDNSRTPIIKVKHRRTGLQCDISFTNGLSVENSKLIKSFNTAYPPCRKLILFLKKWILLGNLTGSNGITNYALTWLVIFYLQVKYKIPSVAALIKSHDHSKIVSGWETGVGNNVPIDVPELSIYELLLGFFEYYGRFDYMHNVVCPLLGAIYYKEFFTEVSFTLPDDLNMALYIAQLRSVKPEYFRIDSPMCVQDPFDLSHNLTKAVPILTLRRFKQYCNESALMLRNHCINSSRKS